MALALKLHTLCDDVRVEVGGTLTAVGLCGERVVVSAAARPIVLPRISFLYVVCGLAGQRGVACRLVLAREGEAAPDPQPFDEHRHAPAVDEHSFVFVRSPWEVGEPGAFVARFEARAGDEAIASSYRFQVERAPG